MNTSFEDQVRERAYHIWLAGGMADGQAQEHWVCAEKAMKAATDAEPVVIITKAKAVAKKAIAAKPTTAAKTAAGTKPAKAKAAAKPAASKKAGKAELTAH